jgi:hypothetical protein
VIGPPKSSRMQRVGWCFRYLLTLFASEFGVCKGHMLVRYKNNISLNHACYLVEPVFSESSLLKNARPIDLGLFVIS